MGSRRCTALAVGLVVATLSLGSATSSTEASSSCHFPTFSSTSILIELHPGAKLVSETDFPLCTTGTVTIAFHGDHAMGCAAAGLCEYTGTDSWAPGSGTATLFVVKDRGRRQSLVFVTLNGDHPLLSQVQRSTSVGTTRICRDRQTAFGSDLPASDHGTTITIGVIGDQLLGTRCAGPLPSDVAHVQPVAELSATRLVAGDASVDLAGTRAFASGGFAGTITSDVTLRTGKPERQTVPPRFRRHGRPTERTVSIAYRLTGLTGDVTARWNTDSASECERLDACGSTGTIRLTPRAVKSQSIELAAYGSPKRPYRDFRAALGLSRDGNPRGITVSGSISLIDDGSVTTEVTQDRRTCRDSTRLAFSSIAIGTRHRRLISYYLPGSDASDALRTRCPGPDLGTHPAAMDPAPLSLLDKRHVTLRLGDPAAFTNGPYGLRITADLSLTLIRTRITQRTF
jgi:hypothetical protein